MAIFGPIPPAPARDFFVFDFSEQIGTSGTITRAVWTCTVDLYSPMPDETPGARIIGAPSYAQTSTSALLGDMLDRVIYVLQAVVDIDDGRVFIRDSELLCAFEPMAMPPVVINGIVQFDYQHFITGYPEFAKMDPDMLQAYWNEASMLFRNDMTSAEPDPANRREILELLTAHVAALFAPAPWGQGGGSVGRVTSKSVNGVSLSYDGFAGASGTETWWLQTQYGAKAWRLLAPYRTMHYVPPTFSHLPRRSGVPFSYRWRG